MGRKQKTETEPKQVESDSEVILETSEETTAPEEQSAAGEIETETGEDSAPELSEDEKLRRQVEELEDKLLRSAAEFDNYKKRTARRIEDIIAAANDGLILSLLQIADSFERAFEHSGENSGENNDALLKGTELIYNQLSDILHKHEVTSIEAVGQSFDPNLHEALMRVASEEHDEGIVTIEMNKGYRKGGRVIRHSKVGVSSGKKNDDDSK